jgi:hypothetical protein
LKRLSGVARIGKTMTPDALRQLIEMLVADSRRQHSNILLLLETTTKLNEALSKLTEAISKLTEVGISVVQAAKQDGENIRSLMKIAEMHERRLNKIDGGYIN